MTLGLDFYDTITAWPTQLRKLAAAVHDSGGAVHVVTAIKTVNHDRTQMAFKEARMPFAQLHIVFYEEYATIPALKVPVYKELGCDVIVEDNPAVVSLARENRLCALQIGDFSDNPLSKFIK